MPNISQKISRHNARLHKQDDQQEQPEPGCNCSGGTDTCPVAGQCQKKNVVYKTSVTTDDGNTEYYTAQHKLSKRDIMATKPASTTTTIKISPHLAPIFGN